MGEIATRCRHCVWGRMESKGLPQMVESGTDEPLVAQLLHRMASVLAAYQLKLDSKAPLPMPLPPSLLRPLFPDGMALPVRGLKTSQDGMDSLFDLIQTTLDQSVATQSRGFLDKLYSGSDAVGQIAELIVAVLNTNVHVYSVSPVATLMEHACVSALNSLIGFEACPNGVFSPGGSASNLLAMTTARNALFPHIKQNGLGSLELKVFASVESHYSISKAAVLMGMGTRAVINVPVESLDSGGWHQAGGGISPSALRAFILDSHKRGQTPYFVNLTSGTTVLSTFDPINACVDVVRELEAELGHRIWVHVDGSYGGPVVVSSKLKQLLLQGIHRVDSVTLNPHKLLGVPQQCSVLCVNTERWGRRVLWDANGLKADYLFHESAYETASNERYRDGEEDGGFMMDLGDATVGCGRKADAVKLFLCWSYHGTLGWSDRVEKAIENVHTLSRLIQKSKFLELVIPFSSEEDLYGGGRLTVSFWCVPPGILEHFGAFSAFTAAGGNKAKVVLRMATKLTHRELSDRGRFMIDYMGLKSKGLPEFIRVAIGAEGIDGEFLMELVQEVEGIVQRLEVDVDSEMVSLSPE
ncbi:pyridoxal phosphate-dependent transferase [Chytriomyces sp. MP71]|nr:pyridoxal phosphate-dependent transferase [Chytriomyces sp. MP71]